MKKLKPTKVALVAIILFLMTGVWGFLVEPGLLVQKKLTFREWPGPPLKIAFFSDLHAGAPHINESYVKNLVQRINEMAPDLILIGGDLVINGVIGGAAIPIETLAPLLKELRAPLGIYSVLGNHDWWNGGERIRATLEKNGIPVLDNKSKLIRLGKDFEFWLVGIGDDYTGHANVELAISQINSSAPRILFMHDPSALFQAKNRFSVSLAGHMHGGQVYIPGLGALITPGSAPREWADGWVEFELGSLFVSKGIGTSIIPIRLNSLPEFVILELNK